MAARDYVVLQSLRQGESDQWAAVEQTSCDVRRAFLPLYRAAHARGQGLYEALTVPLTHLCFHRSTHRSIILNLLLPFTVLKLGPAFLIKGSLEPKLVPNGPFKTASRTAGHHMLHIIQE